ncbi:hypothetical protein L6164_009322 [Bauhinia variegata]|uniref:Uncharacterized protein n=1 Tax=Bauhinia variegata TaxID=167791 RepID=A0ACB9PJG8_BAUVA|nr:hypothetical protein L6164_009322 [Bauhinia variegata]
MAMPWGMTLWMAKMVLIALSGWVSSCLIVADEFASALRSGDIGPFHLFKVYGKYQSLISFQVFIVTLR